MEREMWRVRWLQLPQREVVLRKVTAVGCTGIYTESDTDGDVVVEDGGYIFISGGEYGIDSAEDIIISGGTVQAEGKYYGLTADGDLRISGGKIGRAPV